MTVKLGDLERKTQDRVVKLLVDNLGYTYLGNLSDYDNRNIIEEELRASLIERGYTPTLADRAIEQLLRAAYDSTKTLYDRNKAVYALLRYGAKIKPDPQAQFETVWYIDWANTLSNRFTVAEEVTVKIALDSPATKRPDVVMYVNGIAVTVLELKRSTVSVSEGIRQNLENQRSEFIEHFFSTVQWVLAGNDSQGLHYGTIATPEKMWLTWKEPGTVANMLDRSVLQVFDKERLLELLHDFVVFDSGIKKLCRPNQFFGVRAAQDYVQRRAGGVIWHTQGSGKSLTMVWLAKWIREHIDNSRVLIITDRKELDEQIENVFLGVSETIHRCNSGADLIEQLNTSDNALLCSLIHKFGRRVEGGTAQDVSDFIAELRKALPEGFAPKGELFVFVDECHRTQAGVLHKAMKEILPAATLIGFTGTPLLRSDKGTTIEQFGPYIHMYKFDEAVRDGVIVDLRYEARDIDQRITEQDKIDQWFTVKTAGLTDVARAELKKKWGTMQQVLSSRSRLNQIVADIVFDMETRARLADGRGNALLVASSIAEACMYYELFQGTTLKGKCGIVTSYAPRVADLKGEDAGDGETVTEHQYNVYAKMLADWFKIEPSAAILKAVTYEEQVKEKFIKEPGQMKLLIVVDKLLTGFDAPSATYLYIDKQMRDHGLFQAICRVNRLDGDDKEYGYIVDYMDLFKSLETAVKDYTSGALDNYDKADVEGLLKDRLKLAKQQLDEQLEQIRTLVDPVPAPKDEDAYKLYFCGNPVDDAAQLKANEPLRLALYKRVAGTIRAFAAVASEASEAGYSDADWAKISKEVAQYEALRSIIKLASADYVDLKMYEPAMRHLIDTYIKADATKRLTTFDDTSFVELLVERGAGAVDTLPPSLAGSEKAVAELIANNVRKVIIDEHPINPKYYDKMSALLDALVKKRHEDAVSYQEYLRQIAELAKKIKDPALSGDYPPLINTSGKRAMFDFASGDENLALILDQVLHSTAQDGWRGNPMKTRIVQKGLARALEQSGLDTAAALELAKAHDEY